MFINYQATDWRGGFGFSFRGGFSRGWNRRSPSRLGGSGWFLPARRGRRRLGIRLRGRLCRLGGYRKLGLNSADCHAPAHASYHPAEEHCQGNDGDSQSASAIVTTAGYQILLGYRNNLRLRSDRLFGIRYAY